MLCPLCHHADIHHYHQDKRRHYFQCSQCQLVFVDPAALLPAQAEKDIYDRHNNDVADLGYRRFLSRFAEPLQAKLQLGAQGLDFGCGPGPVLSLMMTEAGFPTAIYDPFYAPDRAPLRQQYDFICCTEAIEHFYRPALEWQLLLDLLKPGAWLGIMTKLVRDPQAFSLWHYKNDLTHVSFFSQATFEFLAHRHQLQLEFVGADVILLQKTA